MIQATPYPHPPQQHNAEGQLRKVGIEIEFSGLEPQQVAEIVAGTFNGRGEKVSEAEYLISCDEFDDFRVELDWQFGKSIAKRRADQGEAPAAEQDDPIMKWMTKIAGQLVPVEIVCPPIALDQLHRLDEMVIELRKAGAIGTEQSFLYAFGLHLNPELPNLSAQTIGRFLQAFVLAQDWLVEQHRVDLSRKITPYVNLFAEKYSHLVVDYSGKNLSIEKVIDDYLLHNTTRNRALDMLPLFKYLDRPRIERVLDDQRINSRPTFHYRLPNCEIERADWLLRDSWCIWCVIEYLAAKPGVLNRLLDQWRTRQDELITLSDKPWHSELDKIYQDLLSA